MSCHAIAAGLKSLVREMCVGGQREGTVFLCYTCMMKSWSVSVLAYNMVLVISQRYRVELPNFHVCTLTLMFICSCFVNIVFYTHTTCMTNEPYPSTPVLTTSHPPSPTFPTANPAAPQTSSPPSLPSPPTLCGCSLHGMDVTTLDTLWRELLRVAFTACLH